MASKTQEERDAADAKRRASQEKARERRANKKPAAKGRSASAKSSAPTSSPRPQPRRKDPLEGYRAGDIETTKLPPLRDSEYRSSGRGDGRAEMVRRLGDAAIARAEAGKGKKDVTYDEWKEMTREERKAAGLPVSVLGGALRVPRSDGPRRGRNAPRMNKGGMVEKSGYAKGGMVQANCGASMKPDGKRKK